MVKNKIISIYISLIMISTMFIFFSNHSYASPSGWSEDIRLSNHIGACGSPSIAVNGKNIHIVWNENRELNAEIYYKRSINNGDNWDDTIRLTNVDGLYSTDPSIAVSGDNIHVTWTDYRDGNDEIYYMKSTDNGDNWGGETRLTSTDGHDSESSLLAVYKENIHVIWTDIRDGNDEIFYMKSIDNGESWGGETRLTSNDGLPSSNTAMAINRNNLYIAWNDFRDGSIEIYYKKAIDNGDSWNSDTRLTSNDGISSFSPSLAVDEDEIYIVWDDKRDGNDEIYYMKSIDNGKSWSGETRLTEDDKQFSSHPSVDKNGDKIHITWHDNRDGNMEIYYKRSIDNGETWESDIRLTNNDYYSDSPSIAVNEDKIHIAWYDERDGNKEIYYKQSMENNTPNDTSDYRLILIIFIILTLVIIVVALILYRKKRNKKNIIMI